MALWDIITLAVIGCGLIYGIWKGFFKIILRGAALFFSIIISKPIGAFITKNFIFGLFSGNKFEAILEASASVLSSIIVFIIVYFLLKLLAGIIAKGINKILSSSKIDRFLGGLLGLVIGCGFMFLVATVAEFSSVLLSELGLSVGWLEFGETYLFRFFL